MTGFAIFLGYLLTVVLSFIGYSLFYSNEYPGDKVTVGALLLMIIGAIQPIVNLVVAIVLVIMANQDRIERILRKELF